MKSQATPLPFDALVKQFSAANQMLLENWQSKLNLQPLGDVGDAYQKFVAALAPHGEQLATLQKDYYTKQFELWQSYLGQTAAVAKAGEKEKGDKRFSAAEWSDLTLFDYVKQSYLLASKWLTDTVEQTPVCKNSAATAVSPSAAVPNVPLKSSAAGQLGTIPL